MISGTETSVWLKSQSSPNSSAEQDPVVKSDPWQINNTMVLGGAALVGFTSLLWTIRKRTLGKGKTRIPLQGLLDDPQQAATYPKLAAYMFAGRAFATATLLVGTGSAALGMGVASAMGVSSLQEFSQRMRELTEKNFPGLRRSGSEPEEEMPDEAQLEFAKEWTSELAREEASGPWTESKSHAIIGNRVRTGLGLQGR